MVIGIAINDLFFCLNPPTYRLPQHINNFSIIPRPPSRTPNRKPQTANMSSNDQTNPSLIGGHAQYVKGAAEVSHLHPPSTPFLSNPSY